MECKLCGRKRGRKLLTVRHWSLGEKVGCFYTHRGQGVRAKLSLYDGQCSLSERYRVGMMLMLMCAMRTRDFAAPLTLYISPSRPFPPSWPLPMSPSSPTSTGPAPSPPPPVSFP